MERVNRIHFHGEPAICLKSEYIGTGYPFQHDHPMGIAMICQTMIVTAIGFEFPIEFFPCVISEKPSVDKLSLASVVMRTTVKYTPFQLGVIRKSRVATRLWPFYGKFFPASSIKQPRVS